MQPDHVFLGIEDERDESVFADRLFGFVYAAAIRSGARRFLGTILTGKIDDRAASAAVLALHFCQRASATCVVSVAGKRHHLENRTWQGLQLYPEGFFVERLCARHVVHIDFKPAHRVSFNAHGIATDHANEEWFDFWLGLLRWLSNVSERQNNSGPRPKRPAK